MTEGGGYAPGQRKSPANPYGFQLTMSRWATLEIRVMTEMCREKPGHGGPCTTAKAFQLLYRQ